MPHLNHLIILYPICDYIYLISQLITIKNIYKWIQELTIKNTVTTKERT